MNKKLAIVFVALILMPQITLAAWWNPFSWSIWDIFRDSSPPIVVEQKPPAPPASIPVPIPVPVPAPVTKPTTIPTPKVIVPIAPSVAEDVHIDSITPSSGSIGTWVVVKGRGFGNHVASADPAASLIILLGEDSPNHIYVGPDSKVSVANSDREIQFLVPKRTAGCYSGKYYSCGADIKNGTYSIRVQNAGRVSNQVVFTVTDPPTVDTVHIMTPNGGETFKIGSRQSIGWASDSNAQRTYAVYFVNEQGKTLIHNVGGWLTTSDVWVVGDTKSGAKVGPGRGRIQVCQADSTDEKECDMSDAEFSIVP